MTRPATILPPPLPFPAPLPVVPPLVLSNDVRETGRPTMPATPKAKETR